MKRYLALLPVALLGLTGCTSPIEQMTCLLYESTEAINCNREAVESSTRAICENVEVIQASTVVVKENEVQLRTVKE